MRRFGEQLYSPLGSPSRECGGRTKMSVLGADSFKVQQLLAALNKAAMEVKLLRYFAPRNVQAEQGSHGLKRAGVVHA